MTRPVPFTATRWSVLAGLAAVMLSSLPRYWVVRDDTRLILLLILLAAVTIALTVFWRMMQGNERAKCPGALKWLAICFMGGYVLMTVWQATQSGAVIWTQVASQGAALGLLLHAVSRLWRERR
ncbi:hypothetical protein [Salinicola aestuarinus]|uniref:hypothetical protein n=1 Tax=Salinicola aestuarinus TaxID=1949082 RepID=UPI000DA1E2BD|nr:hypothetical protein [Salinicola aestuarinus]